jgi:hypothetical protein
MIITPGDPVGTYLLTLSVVTGLGAFALAADAYARLPARRRGRVLAIYAITLTIAIGCGGAVLGWRAVAGRLDLPVLALSAPIGLAVGLITRRLDRSIVRRAARRGHVSAARRASPADASLRVRPRPAGGALLLGGSARRQPGAHRGREGRAQVDPRQFGLAAIIAVAMAEELFYRGFLLRVALQPGSWPAGLLVAATVMAFLLSHLTFGWPHVVAKAPLGIGAVSTVLVLETVLPALIAHVWFNISAWRDLRSTGGTEIKP